MAPFVGRIVRVGSQEVELDAIGNLKPGDGIVFDTGGNTDREQGGRIFEIGGEADFSNGRIDFSRLAVGHRVWKTSDPQLEKALRRTFQGPLAGPEQALQLRVSGRAEQPLEVTVIGVAPPLIVRSGADLAPARKHGLEEMVLREHLGRLGGTGYRLEGLDCELPPIVHPGERFEHDAARPGRPSGRQTSAGGDGQDRPPGASDPPHGVDPEGGAD